MSTYMDVMETMSGSQAQCYISIGDDRYNFMQLTKFEAKMDMQVSEIPILGRTGKAHKTNGWTGTWSGTAHYNQSELRKMMSNYKNTGIDSPFKIQIRNEDPSSFGKIKAQDITLSGCLIKSGVLAKFDTGAEYLEEDIEGTFDDFLLSDTFEGLKKAPENTIEKQPK